MKYIIHQQTKLPQCCHINSDVRISHSTMAASSADFQWYNDVDDEHPIGQGPTQAPSATLSASPGPSNRVRQLRGQPKPMISSPSPRPTPAVVVARTQRKSTRK